MRIPARNRNSSQSDDEFDYVPAGGQAMELGWARPRFFCSPAASEKNGDRYSLVPQRASAYRHVV